MPLTRGVRQRHGTLTTLIIIFIASIIRCQAAMKNSTDEVGECVTLMLHIYEFYICRKQLINCNCLVFVAAATGLLSSRLT